MSGPMKPDPTLFGLQRRLLRWLVDCMDWGCDRESYVAMGRPIYWRDGVYVWRTRGPYQQQTGRPDLTRDAVDLGITCVTCAEVNPELFPDGTLSMPSPAQWEAAAAAHEGDVAAIYGLLKHRGKWLGILSSGVVDSDPDSEVGAGCFGTTIRLTVPWVAGAKCADCPEPAADDGSVC